MNIGRSSISMTAIVRVLFVFLGLYMMAALLALWFAGDQWAEAVRSSPWTLAGFVLIICGSLALRLLRWLLLNRIMGASLPKSKAAQIYIGGFTMVFSPGRVGEIWRAWALKRHGRMSYRRALPILFCDRLFDLKVLTLFAAMGVFFAPVFLFPSIIACFILLPLIALALAPKLMALLTKGLWRLMQGKARRFFAFVLSVCREIEKFFHPAAYLKLSALSLAAWGMEAFGILFVILNLGGEGVWFSILSILGISNLTGVVTLLPGGVGAHEVTMSYLLTRIGNPVSLAVIAVAIVRLGTVFFAALLGFPFFIRLSQS